MKDPQRVPKAGLNVEEFIGGAKTAAADAAPAKGKARKKRVYLLKGLSGQPTIYPLLFTKP